MTTKVLDKDLTVNPKYTYTKTEYARMYTLSRPTVDRMIKDGELNTIAVNGTILIVKR